MHQPQEPALLSALTDRDWSADYSNMEIPARFKKRKYCMSEDLSKAYDAIKGQKRCPEQYNGNTSLVPIVLDISVYLFIIYLFFPDTHAVVIRQYFHDFSIF